MKTTQTDLQYAAQLIVDADALVIAAGAGIGVDSGLPDFRGSAGFWQAYPALAKANLDFAQVASPQTFADDPSLAWGFYGHRLALYRQTVPHAGFNILRHWAERMPLGARVFTSNVDGQFQKAGFPEEDIHECHGSIHHLQCTSECKSGVWRAEDFVPTVDVEACRLLNDPPRCPECGALARPNILMFNDWHWKPQRSASQARAEAKWLDTVGESRARIVVIEIGAGTAIPSVRHFSHRIIHEFGGRLVRINPQEHSVPTSMDVGLPGSAACTLMDLKKVLSLSAAGGVDREIAKMPDRGDELPSEIVDLIGNLIRRPDVQSVSFSFKDESVWRLLVKEQLARSRSRGVHRQHAFALCAGDDGLPFDPEDWGGFVHIPYEGVCESDFFVKPPWRGYDLKAANGDGDLTSAMLGKSCHHVLMKGTHPELESANRTVVAGWTLYTSKKPYKPCNPFLGVQFDDEERLNP